MIFSQLQDRAVPRNFFVRHQNLCMSMMHYSQRNQLPCLTKNTFADPGTKPGFIPTALRLKTSQEERLMRGVSFGQNLKISPV